MYNLKILLIILTVNLLTVKSLDKALEPSVTVNLQRDLIIKTFKAALSSDYMQQLVNEFASKATSHLIQEVKNKEQQIYKNGVSRPELVKIIEPAIQPANESPQPENNLQESLQLEKEEEESFQLENDDQDTLQIDNDIQESRAARPFPPATKATEDLSIINEREAYALIDEPSPDGDNLYTDTEDLTDNDSAPKSDIPVIEVRKINGVYYRRLLGVISKHY